MRRTNLHHLGPDHVQLRESVHCVRQIPRVELCAQPSDMTGHRLCQFFITLLEGYGLDT